MKPPRRRSLTLASQQKSFLCFSFARAGFFLLKGKENFFAGFCSQRAGRRDWPLFFEREWRNSPHTPLPPFPFGDGRNFWRRFENEWHPRQDSNPQVLGRIEAVYPLAYEGNYATPQALLKNARRSWFPYDEREFNASKTSCG